MAVLAIANQKGGVGKTTTSINLAASLVATKKSVLLVDLDPQGNATMGSGINKNELGASVYDVLMGDASIEDAIIQKTASGYDLLATNADLVAAEVGLLRMKHKEYQLCSALDKVKERYKYIIIDCPPALNMLTVNGLVASDGVIIPMQCEYFALEGLSDLMRTIDRIQESLNPHLEVEGILRTMYDPRNGLTRDVSDQLMQHFPNKVYRTCIPRNVRLAEAPSHGLAALHYDKSSRGAMAYLALVGEILRKKKVVAAT